MPPSALRPFIAESPIHRAPIADAVAVAAAALPPGTRVLDAGAGDAPYRPLFAHCTRGEPKQSATVVFPPNTRWIGPPNPFAD